MRFSRDAIAQDREFGVDGFEFLALGSAFWVEFEEKREGGDVLLELLVDGDGLSVGELKKLASF
jgi:hypothetical protein